MTAPRHILICGERGAGKSTLIRRLLADCPLPVYGFVTRRGEAGETGFHPVYIMPASGGMAGARLIGSCDSRTHRTETAVFDGFGAELIGAARPGGIIVMDELGFMEAGAETFRAAVFAALDGDIPVIAAVKARFDVEFLNAVRAHRNAEPYTLTPDNREALCAELLPTVRGWRGE